MIDLARAREIAANWHGGQSSPLYSFTSTGELHGQDHIERLIGEIGDNISDCQVALIHGPNADAPRQRRNLGELADLREYVRSFEQ